ncbi:G-protein coupled receptor family C group 5 member C isoform X2 [Pseudoliparis swirei]|uniref:G-protein coupled receptor family C group 5 member C isoform X2 n=1 Tax=Pseudoliparis swirei TaxID=2059687 RepID=UPI0024BEA888|nr:G-protein coupled receptor family C group 5 member C isoform X2 [Pseudoliparis swirei]
MATNGTPAGCGPDVASLYYNLCDLGAAWGVVLEALAAAGVVFSFVLLIALLASVPFARDQERRSAVALNAGFLVGTFGLFGLTFAFIVGKDFSTCCSRRFLFGVLFAGCFACLLMQSVRLNVLARRGGGAPRAWVLCLAAAALWLVEVVINTEWLIITVVRRPPGPPNVTASAAPPCDVANEDFVMALIYVMVLILAAAAAASLAVMAGKHGRWKKDAAFIVLTSVASVGIWVAWIVMYVYGNARRGGPSWDDPTLAIALVANAWAFLLLYTIPDVCGGAGGGGGEDPLSFGEDLYPNRAVGYETILKEQKGQNMFVENKAFSMEEPKQASQPVSPYSGYSGQLRGAVYQPTELALISKAAGHRPPEVSCDMTIPRASTHSAAGSGSGTPPPHGAEAGSAAHTQPNGTSVTAQHRATRC